MSVTLTVHGESITDVFEKLRGAIGEKPVSTGAVTIVPLADLPKAGGTPAAEPVKTEAPKAEKKSTAKAKKETPAPAAEPAKLALVKDTPKAEPVKDEIALLKKITPEEVQAACEAFIDKYDAVNGAETDENEFTGGMRALKKILKAVGAERISLLPEEKYAQFLELVDLSTPKD